MAGPVLPALGRAAQVAIQAGRMNGPAAADGAVRQMTMLSGVPGAGAGASAAIAARPPRADAPKVGGSTGKLPAAKRKASRKRNR